MKYQLNNFEKELTNLLEQCVKFLHDNEINGNNNWTLEIKKELAQLGTSKEYKICTSGFQDEYNNEWLYDLVWYSEDDSNKLIDVPLVVESEWGSNLEQIKFDFEKLLLANSTNKLMICQCYKHNYEKLTKYFESAIQSYRLNRTGDRYLFAILDIDNEVFNFEVFEKK